MIAATPPWIHPWPIGAGPRYQPAAAGAVVRSGASFGRFRCGPTGRLFDVHVELFARRRVVVVPAGIGVARGGCRYQLSTTSPTGVVHVRASGRWTLGDLFAVWHHALTPTQLLSFNGRVSVFVAGRRISGDPSRIRLTRHAQIVVETGGYVPPHPSYLFPRGRK